MAPPVFRLVWKLARDVLIQIDAQSGPIRRQSITLLELHSTTVEEFLPSVRLPTSNLEDGAVGRAHVDVQGSNRAYLTLGIVRRKLDSKRFCHGRNLPHFEDSATVDHVGLNIV